MSAVLGRALGRAAAAAAAAVVLLTLAGPAAAASCWQELMNDWYDGSIDKTYPPACYRQAMQRLPDDLANYSSAREDIMRALQQATVPTPTKPAPAKPAPTTTAESPASAPPPATTTRPTTTAAAPPASPAPKPPPKRPQTLTSAADPVSGDSSSLPVPLLVLGGLALALVAAGGGGMLWRRYRTGPDGPP